MHAHIHSRSVLSCVSHVQLFVTLWTVACQAALSMGLSRQKYWNELPFPSPGDLPFQGLNLSLLYRQASSLPLSHQGSQVLTKPQRSTGSASHSTGLGWSLTSDSQCLSQLGSCPNLVPTPPGQAGAHLRAACECYQGQSLAHARAHCHLCPFPGAPAGTAWH